MSIVLTNKGIIQLTTNYVLKPIFSNLDKSSKYVRICQKVKVISEGNKVISRQTGLETVQFLS